MSLTVKNISISTNDISDSCPPSPSPRSRRRTGIKNMLKTIAESHRKKTSGNNSSGSSGSDSSSSEVSPRYGWTSRRLSLPSQQSPRSTDISPRSDGSETESPRDISDHTSGGIKSPRTVKLLRRASVKLALKNNDDITVPSTPRNSIDI